MRPIERSCSPIERGFTTASAHTSGSTNHSVPRLRPERPGTSMQVREQQCKPCHDRPPDEAIAIQRETTRFIMPFARANRPNGEHTYPLAGTKYSGHPQAKIIPTRCNSSTKLATALHKSPGHSMSTLPNPFISAECAKLHEARSVLRNGCDLPHSWRNYFSFWGFVWGFNPMCCGQS
ncbi:hypothetical protein CC86DRAFT_141898 [Ophiobolus disseminans]|uniref:Uncharacterized protein n=1 Tax=Ophiobolus disseminans TaxID=1469910 RepID=A0A6A7AEB3_9PLEO|nr:hypothetical protein CC86DRAFT_141898 [Ophiobolus disseminans]